MTTTSVALIASVLRQPRADDDLRWVRYDAPFRTSQDYAAVEYHYRLRVCSLQLRSSLLTTATAITFIQGEGRAEREARLHHYPILVTAQLLYLEEPLTPVVETSAVYPSAALPLWPPPRSSSPSPSADAPAEVELTYTFTDEWLLFPLELCDVPLDAVCAMRLWHGDAEVGQANFHVYSVAGELCVGQRQLVLRPPGAPERDAPVADACAAATNAEELLAVHHRGMMPQIPWLDALSIGQLEAVQEERGRAALRGAAASAALLTVHLPTATTAVFFEPAVARVSCGDALGWPHHRHHQSSDVDEAAASRTGGDFSQRPFADEYAFFKEHNLCEAKAAVTSKSQYALSDSSAPPGPKERHQLASLLRRPPIQLDGGAVAVAAAGAGVGVGVGVGGRLEETRLLWKYRNFVCRDAKYFLPFMRCVDWANTHSSERRAAVALMRCWATPAFADVLACLSYYFSGVAPVRQYAVRLLGKEGDARLCQLVFQLVQAVRYDSAEAELAELLVERALGCWELCSTLYTHLTVEVALERRRGPVAVPGKLSGAAVLFKPLQRRLVERLSLQCPHFIVRLRQQHAMHRVLQQLSRQLQQSALDRLGKAALGNKLIGKHSCGLRELFFSVRHATSSRRAANVSFSSSLVLQQQQPAAAAAAAESSEVGADGVDTDAGGSGTEASDAESDAGAGASGEGGGAEAEAAAQGRHRPPPPSLPAQQESAAERRPPPQPHRAAPVDVLDRYGVTTLATHPGIPITGLLPDSLYIFKSATLPMRLTFSALRPPGSPGASTHSGTTSTCALMPLAIRPAPSRRSSRARITATAAAATAEQEQGASVGSDLVAGGVDEVVSLAMMYKHDDDVRQDQLIAQFIRLMDDLLLQDGLQLYLTPYRVVATGPQEGLVEVVPQVTTFFSVQRDVLKYLRVYNPTAELLRHAMDRYTRSFAGYCVITFVLGIGDRHLENILVAQDGRLLHIDFGYVLGNDPKPFPPPMKINREMVEVLGGPQSTGFAEFKLYCCSAYNTLRKHAPLLLHMLLLGAHAEGMPQVTGESGDPRVNLLKVQEKLRLDLSNAQATQYLQNVIADSVGSIFTNLWDVLHAAVQATRG
ncbi:phosphatidylinositol 3-kinase [Novymonas esmeraldas]|uniref:phosphatidylinositol 3-kinase n=1 Tax=Novymonas esmeraldas TaxID=1808958 RepID=A0AAW0EV74_9TRYP